MKKTIAVLFLVSFLGSVGLSSCVRSKKSCKASHKRMKQMRKSGQIQM